MKKYLFIIMAVCGLILASCGSESKKSEEPKDIITAKELVGGVWVSASFYSEDMQSFIPIVDREAMIAFVFQKNGTCQIGFGSGGVSEAFTFELNHNKLVLRGAKKDLHFDIKDYTNSYLEVVIKSEDFPKDMRCKLKRIEED